MPCGLTVPFGLKRESENQQGVGVGGLGGTKGLLSVCCFLSAWYHNPRHSMAGKCKCKAR